MQAGRFPAGVAVQRDFDSCETAAEGNSFVGRGALYYHMPKVNRQVPAVRFISFGEKS